MNLYLPRVSRVKTTHVALFVRVKSSHVVFACNRRLKSLPTRQGYCLEGEKISRGREGSKGGKEPKPRSRSAFRRVIDNDNFVSASPRTVLTSGLYLLHRGGGPHEWMARAGRQTFRRDRRGETERIAARHNAPAGSDASRQRIAVFCPIELNVKHGLTSI